MSLTSCRGSNTGRISTSTCQLMRALVGTTTKRSTRRRRQAAGNTGFLPIWSRVFLCVAAQCFLSCNMMVAWLLWDASPIPSRLKFTLMSSKVSMVRPRASSILTMARLSTSKRMKTKVPTSGSGSRATISHQNSCQARSTSSPRLSTLVRSLSTESTSSRGR